MQHLHLSNKSDEPLFLIIEPWADRYVIEPGVNVDIEAEEMTSEILEIQYLSSTELALWTHGFTRVLKNGELLQPH